MTQIPLYCEVSPEEVQTRIERGDNLQLIDVRQPWEYENSHIPGIALIPLGELAARFPSEITPGKAIICICEHGVRSRNAASFLARQGCTDVSTMTGGMAEYHGRVENGPFTAVISESHE